VNCTQLEVVPDLVELEVAVPLVFRSFARLGFGLWVVTTRRDGFVDLGG
jgi:hypothetical protein